MKMQPWLPAYEEVIPGSPGLGHMPRAMASQDNTDAGIVARIQQAVQMGYISPKAAQYLTENMLQGQAQTASALRGMPSPRAMPELENTIPYGHMRGLLD